MSLIKSPAMTEANLAAHQANARCSSGPSTPEGCVRAATANLRHGFYSQSRREVLNFLGEDPDEYLDLMQSLQDDLRPRPGLEFQLVGEMGETFWRMRRARHMQEGQARRDIKMNYSRHAMIAKLRSGQALALCEPYEDLEAAFLRRGGLTPEAIETFAGRMRENASPAVAELINHLTRLALPMEESERRKARRQALAELRALAGPLRWDYRRCIEANGDLDSPENLAAMMVPNNEGAKFLQRMEDSNLRRLARLVNLLKQFRQGELEPREDPEERTKNADWSGDMYENTGPDDTMPDEPSDTSSQSRELAPDNASDNRESGSDDSAEGRESDSGDSADSRDVVSDNSPETREVKATSRAAAGSAEHSRPSFTQSPRSPVTSGSSGHRTPRITECTDKRSKLSPRPLCLPPAASVRNAWVKRHGVAGGGCL